MTQENLIQEISSILENSGFSLAASSIDREHDLTYDFALPEEVDGLEYAILFLCFGEAFTVQFDNIDTITIATLVNVIDFMQTMFLENNPDICLD